MHYGTMIGDNTNIMQRIIDCNNLELQSLEYTDHNSYDMENDLDPDNNFFATINDNCRYYTDEQYNQIIKTDGNISIIHFNSRSLYANFNSIKDYLSQFSHPFDIIAISETWINMDKGVDFELAGYEFNYINRRKKTAGGVAVYVINNLNYKVVESMTTAIDNLVECITIEICLEKSKNILISCLYRAPDTNLEVFKDWMEEVFTLHSQKTLFICGEGGYDLRGETNFKTQGSRTRLKCFCITIYGVKLWNSMNVDLKQCPSINHFKKRYKQQIFKGYRDEAGQ